MKRIGVIKIVLLYFFACCVMMAFAYLLCGEPIALLEKDILIPFCNIKCLYVYCIVWGFLSVFFACYFFNNRSALIFVLEISVGTRKFKIYDLCKKIAKKWVFGLILCVALVCSFVGIKEYTYMSGQEKWNEYSITHAFGRIDGVDYTNSLEAFEESYARGQRVFEVDFGITSDNKVVCKHDWADWESIPTAEEFLSVQINGKYTPLSLDDCLFLLEEYDDIWIVTDTKSTDSRKIELEFQTIMDIVNTNGMASVLDRLIIQIYNREMLMQIKKFYDFPCLIFTLYQSGWDGTTEEFVEYCKFSWDNGIKDITIPVSMVTDEVIAVADRYGIRLYVHTVNDIHEARSLMQRGVSGIYTDEIVMSELLKEE